MKMLNASVKTIHVVVSLLLYLLINSLFVIKYTARQLVVSEFVVVLSYIVFMICVFFCLRKSIVKLIK